MERILISACLTGAPVRYDGRAKDPGDDRIAQWATEGRLVPLCPEVAGGFATPRAPAEIEPGGDGSTVLEGHARVIDQTGKDVTAGFRAGAGAAVALARKYGCHFALLVEGSPSCGATRIHGGRFDGQLRPGSGVVAAALSAAGVAVFGHDAVEGLALALDQAENPPF